MTRILPFYCSALVCALFIGFAARADEPISVFDPFEDPYWSWFLTLDRNYNVYDGDRKRPTLSAKEKEVVNILVYERHPSYSLHTRVDVHGAEDPDQNVRDILFRVEKGKIGRTTYTRIYIPEDHPLQKLIQFFLGPPKEKWKGTRLQSHNTYLVWNPNDSQKKPWFMKFFKTNTGSDAHEGPDVNTSRLLKPSNDLSELLTQLSTQEMYQDVSFYSEPASVHLKQHRSIQIAAFFSYGIRENTPLGQKEKSFLPLHGVLGNEYFLKKLAGAYFLKNNRASENSNQLIDQWLLQEYLPKLAQFLAKTQLEHGVFPETHTQNLLIHIDEATGKIQNFAFRDLATPMLDPLTIMIKNGQPVADRFLSGRYTTYLNLRKELRTGLNIPGVHQTHYTLQAAAIFSKKSRVKYAQKYLEEFFAGARKIAGENFELSSIATQAIKNLNKKTPPAFRRFFLDDLNQVWTQNFAATLQEIYEHMTDRTVQLLNPDTNYDQQRLRQLFLQKMASTRSYLHTGLEGMKIFSEEKKKLPAFLFGYENGKIMALHPRTKKILSMAFNLNSYDRSLIEERVSFPEASKLERCRYRLRQLLGKLRR